MKARALVFRGPLCSPVLSALRARTDSGLQPGVVCLPRAQLASRRLTVGDRVPRGLQQKTRWPLAEMTGKKARKNAQPSPSRAPAEVEVECAIQLRRIGDKLSFRQKLLNLIAKLFRSGT